ncbi:MAG: hypothetical protein JXA99_15050 [Candidatus Lokiarchaeota archaeon]|nr:hypothetical protein [Candidatus Lokiarchaeota archaeon]
MSKFERHKKSEEYVYPHKHCKKCEDMIIESYTYCPKCYKELLERKNKKGFFKRIFSRKKKNKI